MRALSVVSDLPGSRTHSLDRARDDHAGWCAEPGGRRDLTETRTIDGRPEFTQRNHFTKP